MENQNDFFNADVLSVEDFLKDETPEVEDKPIEEVETPDEFFSTEKPKTETETSPTPPIEGETTPTEEGQTDEFLSTEESQSSLNYKSIISKLIEVGEFEEFDGIEDEEGNFVPFSELDIDDELFTNILKNLSDKRREALLSDKIEIDGVSDFTKTLIQIEKSGGNVKQALEVYEKYQDPLSKIDLTTEQGSIEAITLLSRAKGEDDETIEAKVALYKHRGTLDEKGEEAYTNLKKASEDYLNNLAETAKQDKIARQEKIKQYKTELKQNLSQFKDIPDAKIRKIVDAATKEDPNTGFEIDRLYQTKRMDTKEAADLALFLVDKEEYNKRVVKEATTKTKIEGFKKLKMAKSASSTLSTNRQRDKKEEETSIENFLN